jgi:ubiquinol-cytochrome c reductase cytochrome c subunit
MSSSPPPASDNSANAAKSRRQRKIRRRVTGALVLMMGLISAGFLASALTPAPQVATASDDSAALIREGKQLYDTSCITCHGANLQGVQDRGPSLIGVGEAAVYFQAARKDPKFDAAQTDALGAFIQANGGGPTLIRDENGEIAQSSLRGGDIGRGSELFRLNCASCHNFTGRGGALSSGKYAPVLDPASEQQIYAAMVTGPQNMPKFSDRQLTIEEKKDIIAYVKSSGESKDPGGYGLGGLGPASEGLAMWAVGIIAVVGAALWIGARS